MNMTSNLYTIGHSTFTVEEVLKKLTDNNIEYLMDVRSYPYSKFASQFNREPFSRFLEEHGVHYFFMGNRFGARPADRTLYTNGVLDFEKVRETSFYKEGEDSILKGLAHGVTMAFMCTEKDPMDCHRAIMVARGFALQGFPVVHIMADGSLTSQEDLDERLLRKYRDRFVMPTLFSYDSYEMSKEDMLKQAYRWRNEEIGYHAGEDTL